MVDGIIINTQGTMDMLQLALSSPVSSQNPGITWGMIIIFLIILYAVSKWGETK